MDATTWHTLWYNLVHLGTPDSDLHPVSLLEKVVRPVAVYLLLVFGLRTLGKRILALLNPFDFVVLLILANTIQNAIIGNDTSLAGGLVGAAALLGVNAVLVRVFYRGPSKALLWNSDRDISLVHDGHIDEAALSRLHINAGELTAKAHERGFDSLEDVESVMLYPNGTMYFRARPSATDAARHAELLRRLDGLAAEVGSLRR
jgi:uncharacterized membrane protein YcaP (DUF421 family)